MNKDRQRYVGHVVSHTHWDRAWYLPFEIFRARLVILVRKLLDVMEKDRRYKFCLDAQTVPIEDYLEIHPEDRGRIEKLVRERRLHVGPFYVLPDQFIVSGESLIRNIAIGVKQARQFGYCQMEGSLSDVFGHPSQVPQILAGFGIPSAIIARGFSPEDKKRGWVQRWEAPDGSSVIAYFCAGGGYANMYYWGMDSFDPALYPTIPVDANEWSVELAAKHVEKVLGAYLAGGMTTKHLFLGNGVDHQEAQPHTPQLIRALNSRRGPLRLLHSTYEGLMNAVRREGRRLPVIKGQLKSRTLFGTMTSRVYQKQDYAEIAATTEMLTEPLLACADVYARGHRAFREEGHSGYTLNPGQNWASFASYPAGQVDHLWKLLLRNAPHDDICGCSVDATHQDMDNRSKRAREITRYLMNDAMLLCASRMAERKAHSQTPVIVAFNPHPFELCERLRCKTFIKGLTSARDLDVVDAKGGSVSFAVDEAKAVARRDWDGNDWTKEAVRGVEVSLSLAPKMRPSSFALYKIVKDGARKDEAGSASARMANGAAVVENEFYRVRVKRDGTFDVFDKGIGRTFERLGMLEDVEDVGNSYDHRRFPGPARRFTSGGVNGKVRILSHDAISTAVEVKFHLKVPAGATPDLTRRTKRLVGLPVRILFEIPHHRKGGQITVSVDNRAKNHELFLAFPTEIAAKTFDYDSKFDFASYAVGEREARIDSVAIVRNRKAAFGMVTDCPTLVASRADARGKVTLGLSLFRAVEKVADIVPIEIWAAYEAQCLRTITRRLEWTTGSYADVRESCLKRRRTTVAPPVIVPVTPWSRLRYLDRRYTTLPVPEGPVIDIKGKDVHLSAWKVSQDGSGWVVRVYSLAGKPQQCRICAAVPVTKAYSCDLAERPLSALKCDGAGEFTFVLWPKEICTLLLKLDTRRLAGHIEKKPGRARVGERCK